MNGNADEDPDDDGKDDDTDCGFDQSFLDGRLVFVFPRLLLSLLLSLAPSAAGVVAFLEEAHGSRTLLSNSVDHR